MTKLVQCPGDADRTDRDGAAVRYTGHSPAASCPPERSATTRRLDLDDRRPASPSPPRGSHSSTTVLANVHAAALEESRGCTGASCFCTVADSPVSDELEVEVDPAIGIVYLRA